MLDRDGNYIKWRDYVRTHTHKVTTGEPITSYGYVRGFDTRDNLPMAIIEGEFTKLRFKYFSDELEVL